MKTIEVYIRPEGSKGYTVGWKGLDGPPIPVAHYSSGGFGRSLADAHKQGMIDGMRAVVNQAESLIP